MEIHAKHGRTKVGFGLVVLGLLTVSVAAPRTGPGQAATPHTTGASGELKLVTIGSEKRSFHVTSTLIVGPTESILWDTQYKLSDGRRVADKIAATGTKLKAIVLSHADHDHYMGAMEVVSRYPGTPVYMSQAGLADFLQRSPADLAAEKRRGDTTEVPDSLVAPERLPAKTLDVDGFEIEVIDGLTGDVRGPASTALWIPSLRTALTGDLVFDGIHPWLGDADRQSRRAWRESLGRVSALHPAAVIPGHKRDLSAPDSPTQIDFMIRYLDDYDRIMETASTADEVVDSMVAKYPDLALSGLMAYGAKTWFGQ